MRPRQASVLAVCLFLREQERDLRVQRSYSVNSLVGFTAPSDPVGLSSSENPS